MPKLVVCAVRDSAVQGFGRPIFVPQVAAATRSFTDEVNRPPQPGQQNDLYSHSEDFELWHLADFDDDTGQFSPPVDGQRCVSRGKDVKASA